MIKAASGKVLEGEIKKAKESERKMLESLVSQTKQLEQAKMELEEARLEIRNLQKSIRGSESARAPSARNLFRSLLEKPPPPSAPARPEVVEEEVSRLKGELRLAMEAEEKDKRAMDGLALALKEVTEEANRAKDKLATAQSELRAASAEADRLKSALEAREDDLRAVSAEVERLRLEAEESAAAWSAKEEGLIGCVKASVEEAARAMRENRRLLDSREEAREENARLRDIMKQALSEADAARAGLEVARRESSQLKRQLSEKAKSLETIRQECECLKAAGEKAAAAAAAAADLQSARQPKCLTTPGRSRSARSSGSGSSGKPEDMFQSERWSNATGPRIQNGANAPEAGAGSFRETGSAGEASPWGKNGTHGTVGCVSSMRLLEAAIKPVYVFDGQPPDLKKQELAKRFSKRADATEDVTTALEDDDKEGIGKYSKSTVKVTRQHNEGSKLLLRLMGVPVVEAPSDAEAECAALFKNGKV